MASELPDFTCHLIDLPGCGTSSTPDDVPLSFPGHAAAVCEAIDALGLDSVTLVGQDSGGLVARLVAATLGERVDALVLTGTEIPGHHPKLIGRLQRMMRLPGFGAVTSYLLGKRWAARSNHLLGGCFWDRDLIEGDFRTAVLDPLLADPSSLDRQLEILASYQNDIVDELAEVHPAITCPTLLIWGQGDPFSPIGKARAMAAQFGGPTRFVAIDKARLLVHEEHPTRFAALTREFLVEHRVAATS